MADHSPNFLLPAYYITNYSATLSQNVLIIKNESLQLQLQQPNNNLYNMFLGILIGEWIIAGVDVSFNFIQDKMVEAFMPILLNNLALYSVF